MHECLCITCVPSVCRGQERILGSLGLELQTVVNFHVVLGTAPWASGRAAGILNWAIFLASSLAFLVNSGPSAQKQQCAQWAEPPALTFHQENVHRQAHSPVWWRQYLSCGFFFPNNWSCVKLTKPNSTVSRPRGLKLSNCYRITGQISPEWI